eukprot:CAMPEP_0180535282 /NCGR_PEP_ID=MMETSP1036_2-20121128/64645_1 /TAXON_ID=632150 /ORGANISM="Azadinium spinosum, Strain 3D9" /LENGTH=86 /DNA_ID=CAMNT_0022549691 /DNA_START=30 /DNA_END=287 /DNA_ORIENTATION=+
MAHDVVLSIIVQHPPQSRLHHSLAKLAEDIGSLMTEEHGIGLHRQRPQQYFSRGLTRRRCMASMEERTVAGHHWCRSARQQSGLDL